jgi:hypothetical protein
MNDRDLRKKFFLSKQQSVGWKECAGEIKFLVACWRSLLLRAYQPVRAVWAPQEENKMRKTLLAIAAALAILATGSVANRADAMTIATPSALAAATSEANLIEQATVVCGYYGCVRIYPRRYYRYRYYGPYRYRSHRYSYRYRYRW